MGSNEHDENEDGKRPSASEVTQPVRRPYAAPRVETYPLFERMALVCDPWMKNTGEDDFS